MPNPSPFENALLNYLLAQEPIQAAVGSRVYYQKVPQKSGFLPAITLRRNQVTRDYDLSSPTGWVTAQIRIHVWSAVYETSREIAAAVQQVMEALMESGANFLGGFEIQNVEVTDDADDPYFGWEGMDDGVFPVPVFFEISYNEL
jgi:hypothetical protein